MPIRPSLPPLLRLAMPAFRALLPLAERDEVVADLEAEYADRAARQGRAAAARWAWRQLLGSCPALLGRGWWRGMSGFEPRANWLQPGGPMFESWLLDLRYAGRRLLRRPAYAALAVLTLALGSGGTAAVFSLARGLLLNPLPIAHEEQVGVLYFTGSWTEQEYLRLRGHFPGFRAMAAYRPNDVTLEPPAGPMRLEPGVSVSADFFDVLGVHPALGRTFQAGDDAVGAEPVALISHALWLELGSDPGLVGRRLELGGVPRTVVGVMPRGFWFPRPTTRVWTAAQLDPQNRVGRYSLVGRIADDQAIDRMDGPLRALTTVLADNFHYPNPQWDKTRNPSVTSARDYFVGDVRPSVLATLAAMAVILLIASANVAALMLGQVDARATEIAVRAALGANRRRLVQQVVIESLLLGFAAGIAGAALAASGFQLLVQSLPLGALADTAHIDWTVFWGAMTAAGIAAVLVAFVPAAALLHGSNLQSTMATTRTVSVGRRGGRLEAGLVIAQMALAVLLSAGAALVIRSVANLRAIDPGIRVDDLVVVDATMPVGLTPDQRVRVIENMLPSLRSLPGVTSVAASQRLPLRGGGDNWGIRIVGNPDLNEASTAFRMVTPEYFQTVGMPLVRGRDFGPSDRAGSDRVVIINEALAAKCFPGEDPVGRVLQTFDDTGERIVGVVGNARETHLTEAPGPARYMLYPHVPLVANRVSFVLRTHPRAAMPALIQSARTAIATAGTRLAVEETTTMRNVFDLAMGPTGQVVALLSVLAGLALVLGAVGVYGVITHYVLRRSREYGIRIALGQQPSVVVRQVVGRGVALTAAGSAIGVCGAMAAARLLRSLLYGIESSDPLALAAAVAVLLAAGLAAAFVPAYRASRTDPAAVLRNT